MADIRRIERTPLEERLCGQTLLDLFRYQHDTRPDRIALVALADDQNATAVQYSYTQLYRRIVMLANLLRAHGVTASAPVTLLMPNLPDMHCLLWAGAIAGIANPINPFLEPVQIAEIMHAAGSRTIVAPSRELAPDMAAKASEVARLVTGFATVFVSGQARSGTGEISLEQCRNHSGEALEFDPAIDPNAVACMLHTGGTTGAPKLVQQTHRNQITAGAIAALVMKFTPDDRVLTGLPLFHTNAAIVTGLAVFSAGGTVILAGESGFRNKEMIAHFWRIVDTHKVTAFCAVPTVLASLMDVPIGNHDISSLRVALCGAAPLPTRLLTAFERQTGMRVLEGYGMTEGTSLSSLNPYDGARHVGSVGLRIPYQDVMAAMLDDAGKFVRACETDETGTLLIRGPMITPGYRLARHNNGAWPLEGWLNTGDLARIDREGYIWLGGRSKDVIIRGGHNIDPAVIEEALSAHPAVDLVAGIGCPDAYAGEVPIAYVTLRPNAVVADDELVMFARKRITERAAAPVEVIVIAAMPVTAVGKIFKPTLRSLAAQDAVAAILEKAGVGDKQRTITGRHDPVRGLTIRVEVDGDVRHIVEASPVTRLPVSLEIETSHRA